MEATTVGDATLQRTLVGAAPHGANRMRRRTIGSGVTRAMNHRTGEEILLMEGALIYVLAVQRGVVISNNSAGFKEYNGTKITIIHILLPY